MVALGHPPRSAWARPLLWQIERTSRSMGNSSLVFPGRNRSSVPPWGELFQGWRNLSMSCPIGRARPRPRRCGSRRGRMATAQSRSPHRNKSFRLRARAQDSSKHSLSHSSYGTDQTARLLAVSLEGRTQRWDSAPRGMLRPVLGRACHLDRETSKAGGENLDGLRACEAVGAWASCENFGEGWCREGAV
jgi:hypothetical protein